MSSITVTVRLYGALSCYGKAIPHGENYSIVNVQLPVGSRLQDLLDVLLMCTKERGFTFINEKMSAMPDVQPDLDYQLQENDQVLFFPLKMLPTRFQFDMKMTDKMTRTVRADENLNLYYFYE
jgi:hypothetical protein